jgi:hypothetical protein
MDLQEHRDKNKDQQMNGEDQRDEDIEIFQEKYLYTDLEN